MNAEPRLVQVRQNVLKHNDLVARELRTRFHEAGLSAISLVSSPGAGKTMFLEKVLSLLRPRLRVAALVGDLATENDAARLARTQVPVRQITTGTLCHLEAEMVRKALEGWALDELDLLFIENVGNLVCPASYDLGEAAKIVVLSTAEGDDKPLKYPSIFFKSALLVLNKIDLLPHVPFSLAAARENARRVHPEMEIVEVSCVTGAGLEDWRRWLREQHQALDAQMIAGIA
jgi:hydrogenase nickel incorporation protein HypB